MHDLVGERTISISVDSIDGSCLASIKLSQSMILDMDVSDTNEVFRQSKALQKLIVPSLDSLSTITCQCVFNKMSQAIAHIGSSLRTKPKLLSREFESAAFAPPHSKAQVTSCSALCQ